MNHNSLFMHKLKESIFLLFPLAQIVLWIYLNLDSRIINDNDAAKVFYHTIAIFENKTFLLSNWTYMTTAEFDCSALLALPIYAFCKDIILSFAISNILNVFIFSIIIYKLLKNSNVSKIGSYLILTIVLIPFNMGKVDYGNMLFFGAGQYIYKAIIPLWMLELMTFPHKKSNLPSYVGYILQVIGFIILNIISVISSGLYVFASALIPIFIVDLFFRFSSSDCKKELLFPLLVLSSTLCGYTYHRLLGLNTLSDSMSFITVSDFISHLSDNILNIFQLINALPSEKVSLYSYSSIFHSAKILFIMIVFIFGMFPLFRALQPARIECSDLRLIRSQNVGVFCSFIFVWNFFILQLSQSTPRYHIIGFIPLIIACGTTIANRVQLKNTSFQIFISISIASFIMFIGVPSWKNAIESMSNYYADIVGELSSLAEEYSTNSIVFLHEFGRAEIARALDPNNNYVTYSNDMLHDYDYYLYCSDRNALNDRHLLLVKDTSSLNSINSNLVRSSYQFIGHFYDNSVYLADVCYLDGVTGPLEGCETIDFPFSPGYKHDSFIDNTLFFASGPKRSVITSPEFFTDSNDVIATVDYSSDVQNPNTLLGYVKVIKDSEEYTVELFNNQNNITFSIPPESNFFFEIYVEEGIRLSVPKITFR